MTSNFTLEKFIILFSFSGVFKFLNFSFISYILLAISILYILITFFKNLSIFSTSIAKLKLVFTLSFFILTSLIIFYQFLKSNFFSAADLINLINNSTIPLSSKDFKANNYVGYPIFVFTLFNYLHNFAENYVLILLIYSFLIIFFVTLFIKFTLKNITYSFILIFYLFFTSLFYYFPKIGNVNYLLTSIYLIHFVYILLSNKYMYLKFSFYVYFTLSMLFINPIYIPLMYFLIFYNLIFAHKLQQLKIFLLHITSCLTISLILFYVIYSIFKINWFIDQLFINFVTSTNLTLTNFQFRKQNFFLSDYLFLIMQFNINYKLIFVFNFLFIIAILLKIFSLNKFLIIIHITLSIFIFYLPLTVLGLLSSGYPYRFYPLVMLFIIILYTYYIDDHGKISSKF